jgi:chemotaxis protein CheX
MSPATTEVAFDTEALYGMLVETWGAYLGITDDEPLARIEDPGPLNVVASISMTGSWDGHVVVSMSEAAALAVAAAMLALELDDVTDADILDAAGELVNVVGGQVKSILPQPCQLSLPMTSRAGRKIRFPGTRPVCNVTTRLRGEPITVSVRQVDLS